MTPPLGHLIIGHPHSGQATLINQLQQQIPHSCLLTPDPTQTSPAELLLTLQQALRQGHTPICNASNADRSWRMTLLSLTPSLPWIAWQLPRPKNPGPSHKAHFPLHIAEGYLTCHRINPHSPTFPTTLTQRLTTLPRSITNRTNRTQHPHITFHPYAALLDFDRLLHLISLLTTYPGLGNLHQQNPTLLATLTPAIPLPQNSLSELSAVITTQRGPLYANRSALTADLHWLQTNHFLTPTLNLNTAEVPLTLSAAEPPHTPPHPYSDRTPFLRLMGTLRFIIHNPLLWNPEQGSLNNLTTALQSARILTSNEQGTLRKDIEKVFKPYKLLPPFPLKRGYFIGTGILTASQLLQLYKLLRSQAKTLEDPTAIDLLQQFNQRLQTSKLLTEDIYPVKAIANRPIFDQSLLPSSALPHTLPQLEQEIEQGQQLELNSFSGGGSFDDQPQGFFLVWPLQIVFYNIAWYLGYEIAAGPDTGLLKFQRIDRLFRGRPQTQQRERTEQLAALTRLQTLQSLCSGLYLGKQTIDQQQVLSRNRKVRQAAFTTVELWFSDRVFKFVSEGSQRFSPKHMQMSPRPGSNPATAGSTQPKTLYSLSPSPDKAHPHRLRVSLPHWSINDVDLRRWIIGFGNQVKVIEPPALVSKIREIGRSVAELYE